MIRTAGIINDPIGGRKDVNLYALARNNTILFDPAVNQSTANQKTLLSYDPKLPVIKRVVDAEINSKQIFNKSKKSIVKSKYLRGINFLNPIGIIPNIGTGVSNIGNPFSRFANDPPRRGGGNDDDMNVDIPRGPRPPGMDSPTAESTVSDTQERAMNGETNNRTGLNALTTLAIGNPNTDATSSVGTDMNYQATDVPPQDNETLPIVPVVRPPHWILPDEIDTTSLIQNNRRPENTNLIRFDDGSDSGFGNSPASRTVNSASSAGNNTLVVRSTALGGRPTRPPPPPPIRTTNLPASEPGPPLVPDKRNQKKRRSKGNFKKYKTVSGAVLGKADSSGPSSG